MKIHLIVSAASHREPPFLRRLCISTASLAFILQRTSTIETLTKESDRETPRRDTERTRRRLIIAARLLLSLVRRRSLRRPNPERLLLRR